MEEGCSGNQGSGGGGAAVSLFQQSCVTKHFNCRNCGACSYCFKPEVCIHCYAHDSGWEGEEIAAGAAVIKSPEEWADWTPPHFRRYRVRVLLGQEVQP